MRFDERSLVLYAVTDRKWLRANSLPEDVEEALKAGVTMVQLREKDIDFESFLSLAKELKKITDKHNVPLIINDNVEIALLSGADGVHVGQGDIDACEARAMIGDEKILGVSVRNVQQAIAAEKDGADYIGVGAVFPTSTKSDAGTLTQTILKEICSSVLIPAVAIGGISMENAHCLSGSGIKGIAAVSSIFAQDDIRSAASGLRVIADKVVAYKQSGEN